MMVNRPYVSLSMGKHSKQELSDWIDENRNYEPSWTLLGYAFTLARGMLTLEKSKHKSIILFSDGDPDKCRTDECEEFLEYDQLIEAYECREQGMQLLYIMVGTTIDEQRAIDVAGGVQNTVSVGDFHNLDVSILKEVVSTLCRPQL
ncbi:hypothetical protein RB195_003253 [Necator americanus]